MAGPELTPEMLAQLEATAQRWIDTDGDMYDDDGKVAEALDALPFLVAAARELAAWRDEEAHDVMRLNAAMLKAEEERDKLRADVESLESRQQVHLQQIAELSQLECDIENLRRHRAKLIADVGTLRAELDDVRRAVDAPGDSGTFEAVARLHDEVTRLRAEVSKLRTTASQACNWLESTSDRWARRDAAKMLRAEILPVSEAAETMVGEMMAEARATMKSAQSADICDQSGLPIASCGIAHRCRAEIERKP